MFLAARRHVNPAPQILAPEFARQFDSPARGIALAGSFGMSTKNPGAIELSSITATREHLSLDNPAGPFLHALKRRFKRERRRRKIGRAYDMALEIARVIPGGSEVLDVGCGNGFIAHHLSGMLGSATVGIDLGNNAEAAIDYRRYDGKQFPVSNDSVDAVLLCYVLHHAQDVGLVLSEMGRVLRDGGLAVVYEDNPAGWWDKGVCWIHDRQWRGRTGPCTFRRPAEWRALFASFGFEIVSERSLSRGRNLTHPVSRRFFVLRREALSAA